MKNTIKIVAIAALVTTAHSSGLNQFETTLGASARIFKVSAGGVPHNNGFENLATPTVKNTYIMPSHFLKNDLNNIKLENFKPQGPITNGFLKETPRLMDFVLPGLNNGFRSPVADALQKLEVKRLVEKPVMKNSETQCDQELVCGNGDVYQVLGKLLTEKLKSPVTHEVAIGGNEQFEVLGELKPQAPFVQKPVMKNSETQCDQELVCGNGDVYQVLGKLLTEKLKSPVTHEVAIGGNEQFEVLGELKPQAPFVQKPVMKDIGTQVKGGNAKRNRKPGEQDNDANLYDEPIDLREQHLKKNWGFDDGYRKGLPVFGENYNITGNAALPYYAEALRHITFNVHVNGTQPQPQPQEGFFSGLYSNIKASFKTVSSFLAISGVGYTGFKFAVAHPDLIKKGFNLALSVGSSALGVASWFRK